MEIREVGSQDTLELRLKILRPKGSLEDCKFPGDDDPLTKHYGAFFDNFLLGIVSIYPREHAEFTGIGFQIRAMATDPQARGKGAGAKLLKKAEVYAFDNDADYVWANARISAMEFYRKSEYTIDDNEFHIEGVGPHVIVSKLSTYHAKKTIGTN